MKCMECLYGDSVGKKLLIVTLKGLFSKVFRWEVVFDYSIDKRLFPKDYRTISTGIYRVTFNSLTEYMKCFYELYRSKSGFICYESEYNDYVEELERVIDFNSIDENDVFWVEPSNSFNDGFRYIQAGLNNTITLSIYNKSHVYRSVAYPVESDYRFRHKDKMFYVEKFLSEQTGSRHNTARKMLNIVKAFKQVIGKTVFDINLLDKTLTSDIIGYMVKNDSTFLLVKLYFLNGRSKKVIMMCVDDIKRRVMEDDLKLLYKWEVLIDSKVIPKMDNVMHVHVYNNDLVYAGEYRFTRWERFLEYFDNYIRREVPILLCSERLAGR